MYELTDNGQIWVKEFIGQGYYPVPPFHTILRTTPHILKLVIWNIANSFGAGRGHPIILVARVRDLSSKSNYPAPPPNTPYPHHHATHPHSQATIWNKLEETKFSFYFSCHAQPPETLVNTKNPFKNIGKGSKKKNRRKVWPFPH